MLFRHLKIVPLFLLTTLVGFTQEQEAVLFSIDKEPVYASEFTGMYNKQVQMLGVDNDNSKKEYFKLFRNYKLKVKEAKDLQLDTANAYQQELAAYRERLIQPYLKDEKASEFLINEAYDRTINAVNASHILIKLAPKFSVQDTVTAYTKISELREKILQGEDFEAIARSYSEDPSAKVNGGNLGYFSAFQMVYPFESAAYSTEVGAVSKPFRTTFGYHIVKTNAFRKMQPKRQVAHIMIANKEEEGKIRIDSIYNAVEVSPDAFETVASKLSDDTASANQGGKLPKMGIGDAIESFEQVVFYELNNEGEISEPFETEYGWHIAKLIKIFEIPSKKALYPELKKKVLADSRSSFERVSLIKKLEKDFEIKENSSAVSAIVSGDWSITDSDKAAEVFSINSKSYTLEDFILFLKRNKTNAGIDAFKKFKEYSILEYYKSHLEETNSTFKSTLTEFSEGLLLFNLMEQEVWIPSKDVAKQQQFFEANKERYKASFRELQGQVISDYQNYLEEKWLEKLKKKHRIEINTDALAKIINE